MCPDGLFSRHSVYGSDRDAFDNWQEIIDAIQAIPTVDPVKHGRWKCYTNDEDIGFHYCSECGQQAFNYLEDETIEVLSDYCPHCGAKMDLEAE